MMESSLTTALAWPAFKAPSPRIFEPAGVHYEAWIIREHLLRNDDFSSFVITQGFYNKLRNLRQTGVVGRCGDLLANENTAVLLPDVDSSETLWLDEETQAYENYLRSLDPRHWKDQDHYKVIGLSTLRYAATDEQIRLAYRKKVLKHHPDKRRHRGAPVKSGEEDYFTCISKAYEVLSNTQKRRAYDSVDPTFDDFIPPPAKSAEEFFATFGPAFDLNERWSRTQPVPKLGDPETPFDEVDRFYRFWYNKFDSWREFSYLDEEDKEKGENREERRWIEKQNKAAREKRRKDELKRLRTLIENAEKSDPRIQKYKDEEKRRKEEEKKAKEDVRRVKLEEEERKRLEMEEEARRVKEREEEAQKQQLLEEKRAKELKKKALQKERKILQDFMKENGFLCDTETGQIAIMTEMNRLCQLLPLERLQALNEELRQATNGTKPRAIFDKFVDELNQHVKMNETSNRKDKENGVTETDSICTWSQEDTQLLVKAMTVFPVGTKSRWDVIAAFINEHRKGLNDGTASVKPKTGKDVVRKVKELEKLDEQAKEMAAKGQALKQSKSAAQVDAPPSVRMDATTDVASASIPESRPWTAEEQKVFEQALRTYPSSLGTERWEKVAVCLPGRTKKECIKRFKELTELVRAKNAALKKVDDANKRTTEHVSAKS